MHGEDGITAEIYQPWLDIIDEEKESNRDCINPKVIRNIKVASSKVDHGDHVHDTRYETEEEALRRETVHDDPVGKRTGEVLLKILLSKSVLDINKIREVVEKMDNTGKLLLGQQLVI